MNNAFINAYQLFVICIFICINIKSKNISYKRRINEKNPVKFMLRLGTDELQSNHDGICGQGQEVHEESDIPVED